MYHIYKIAPNTVVDFAAEELKKYLRMMMPRCGGISIDYRPDSQTYLEASHTTSKPLNFYKPEMEAQLLAVEEVAKKYAAIFDEHRNMPYRVQTVAMRLMRHYTDFCTGYAGFMALKCLGKDAEAKETAIAFLNEFGKREQSMEHYYDHFMVRNAFNAIINTKSDFDQ